METNRNSKNKTNKNGKYFYEATELTTTLKTDRQ